MSYDWKRGQLLCDYCDNVATHRLEDQDNSTHDFVCDFCAKRLTRQFPECEATPIREDS